MSAYDVEIIGLKLDKINISLKRCISILLAKELHAAERLSDAEYGDTLEEILTNLEKEIDTQNSQSSL